MSDSSPSSLRAGAACVDITPPLGTHLAGSGMGDRRPAQEILDPLFARAVLFDAGDRRICLITLDVTIVTAGYSGQIRAAVSAQLDVAPEAVLVCATQTHSAPSLGPFMLDADFPLASTPETEYLWGAESAYGDLAARAAVDAAQAAAADLQPVRLDLGRAIVGDLAFNRRGVRRDGTILMPKPQGRERQPLGITELCYLEGPIDPEVGVLRARRPDGAPVAVLLHHTCHPVNTYGNPETYGAVSADWPGAWIAALDAGGEAMVLNGCCGNINPWHPFDPDCRPDHLRMGGALASTTRDILRHAQPCEDGRLAWCARTVRLPYRDIPPHRQREVEQILRDHPEPPRPEGGEVDPRWFRAASTRSVELCRRRAPAFAYEIQAFRVGDLALIGLPGEPFVEGQLDIKVRSRAPYTFVAHMASHYVGYLPTRPAYERGGHEANEDVTYWAKLAPGCLETVADVAVDMVAELFG